MQAATPSLSVRSLACRRGDRLLFRKLNFALGAGQALHITGANGTGKTTLIRTLAGLTAPFAGEVARDGAMGLLDERPALDPELPLGRALKFWSVVDRSAEHDADHDAVRVLGLGPLLDVPVRYLSTGQRKRAALAVLMGRNVPIWLLDEPLSGLDTGAIDLVTRLIADHVADGGIALIASHQSLAIDGLQMLELGDYVPHDAAEDLP